MDLFNGDCLKVMDLIPDKSIDLIFTDPPYGTTQNNWDSIISFDELWKQYKRVIKDNGCIALWAQSPFDKLLACSNLEMYRYEWIVEKTKATGFLNANRMPLKAHENILIFYKKLPTYNPQMSEGHSPVHSFTKNTTDGPCYGKTKIGISGGGSTQRFPRDVLKYKWDTQKSKLHNTQKPLECCEYIIKTYTNENDVVLDSCMGSNTTGLACKNLNRGFIGIELEKPIYEVATKRVV